MRRLSSIFFKNIFAIIVILFVLATVSHTTNAQVSSSRETVDVFIENFDEEKEYQVASEALVTPPGNRGNGGAANDTNENGIPDNEEIELEEFNMEEFQHEEAVNSGKQLPQEETWWEKGKKWVGDKWEKGKKWVKEQYEKLTRNSEKEQKIKLEKAVQKENTSKWEQLKGWFGNKAAQAKAIWNSLWTKEKKQTISSDKKEQSSKSVEKDTIPLLGIITPEWLKPLLGQTQEQKAEKDRKEDERKKEEIRKKKIEEINKKYGVKLEDGKTKKWELTELVWVEETLAKVPSHFYEKESFFAEDPLNNLVREKASERENDTGTCGEYSGMEIKPYFTNSTLNLNKRIVIYDKASNCISNSSLPHEKENNQKLSFQITLTHELVHAYVSTHTTIYNEYLSTFWEEKEVVMFKYKKDRIIDIKLVKRWVPKEESEKPVSEYGGPVREIKLADGESKVTFSHPVGDPEEDFSEVVSYYLYESKYTENHASKKVNFIKEKVLIQ